MYILTLIGFLFVLVSISIYFYRMFAIGKNIVANPNYRTLHVSPIPTGGGIVFAIFFVVGLFYLWRLNQLPHDLFVVLVVGGVVATLFGFLDDLIDLRAELKLMIQLLLSGWTVFYLGGEALLFIEWLPPFFSILVTTTFLVCMINGYNFIDGIDGMAISGAVFVSATIIGVLLLTQPDSNLIIVMILLLSSSSAFLFFNWPPASIFMGDAGSVFLGYIFGLVVLMTARSGDISLWTWLVVFGYFVADLIVTQIMRVIFVKKWYKAHRSHAYQNLARISGSHLKVTGGVLIYNLVWILPLTLWSATVTEMAPYAATLAILPGIVVAYKYGPLLSSS